jgi:hypothetical protein
MAILMQSTKYYKEFVGSRACRVVFFLYSGNQTRHRPCSSQSSRDFAVCLDFTRRSCTFWKQKSFSSLLFSDTKCSSPIMYSQIRRVLQHVVLLYTFFTCQFACGQVASATDVYGNVGHVNSFPPPQEYICLLCPPPPLLF